MSILSILNNCVVHRRVWYFIKDSNSIQNWAITKLWWFHKRFKFLLAFLFVIFVEKEKNIEALRLIFHITCVSLTLKRREEAQVVYTTRYISTSTYLWFQLSFIAWIYFKNPWVIYLRYGLGPKWLMISWSVLNLGRLMKLNFRVKCRSECRKFKY